MASRNHRFKDFKGPDAEGKLVTRYNAQVNETVIFVELKTDVYDTAEEIQEAERRALNELEEKVKNEDARQKEAALGFGYIGG